MIYILYFRIWILSGKVSFEVEREIGTKVSSISSANFVDTISTTHANITEKEY